MGREKSQTEYVLQADGSEICPECGHLWNDYGAGHYHDCRYFTLGDEMEEEVFGGDDLLRRAQVSLFRPAA
jgi:uncharacterized Zn ribbon protein